MTRQAVSSVSNMLESHLLTLKNTLFHLIHKCKNMKELKQIHTQIIKSPIILQNDQYFLISRLLFFCALSDLGSLHYANDVFRFISMPNLYIFNVMIRACASHEDFYGEEYRSCSLNLYKKMLSSGIKPDFLTFPFIVKECTRWVDVRNGTSIHAQSVKLGLFNDIFVQNSFIAYYHTCRFSVDAQKVFDGMLSRDIVSWNSMIIGLLRNGELNEALSLFKRMKEKSIISWNSIITGLVQGGRPKEALELFHEMQITSNCIVRPDKITIASVLSACSYLGAIHHGKWVHEYFSKSGLECDMVIGTALVDMYGKCGFVDQAYEVFKKMPHKDTLAWTAMISVLALNGNGEHAFDLFKEMELNGVKPNQVTFVGLLSVCAHSGLVEKGRLCFEMMSRVYALEPQVHHYACLVDILSRAGLLEEAERVIRSMPMAPDVFVWGALLGGCQMHGNVDLGEKVSQYLIELEPQNHAFYFTLCDIYWKANRFENVNRVRTLMAERGIRKEVPGCSMIEIDGSVYEFSVKGSPTVAMEELVRITSSLRLLMKGSWDILYYHIG